MAGIGSDIKGELKKGLDQLATLRDEVRVKVHLASMDLKDEWSKLEPRLIEAEKKATADATEASQSALQEVLKKLAKLRAALH